MYEHVASPDLQTSYWDSIVVCYVGVGSGGIVICLIVSAVCLASLDRSDFSVIFSISGFAVALANTVASFAAFAVSGVGDSGCMFNSGV